jgi:hypothetical protein
LKVVSKKVRALSHRFQKDANQIDQLIINYQRDLGSLGFGALIIGRKTGDVQFRACAIYFAEIMFDLFGKHFAGSVGAIVSMFFPDRDTSGVSKIIESHFDRTS